MEPCKNQKTQFFKNEKSGLWELQIFNSDRLLGISYDNGEGVAKDQVEAVKWYRKAADQGLAPAQSNLGLCYANGEGVAKDQVEAVKWYRKAADQKLGVRQEWR